MEIREQQIDRPDPVGRVQENLRIAVPGADRSVRFGAAFERPDRRCADSQHPFPGRVSRIDQFRGFGRQKILFAVHLVLFGVFDRHRLEGSGADVQRHRAFAHPRRGEFRENFRCEMEPGRRRGHRPGLVCIDGLVPFGVGGLVAARDIGRQRNMAVLHLQPVGIRRVEFNDETAVVIAAEHGEAVARRIEGAAAVEKYGGNAGERPFSRLQKRVPLPPFGIKRLNEQQFELRAGRVAVFPGVHAAAKDARIVVDQGVSGREIFADRAERPDFTRSGGPVEHEHARAVATPGRMLGDQLFRQIVIEKRGAEHKGPSAISGCRASLRAPAAAGRAHAPKGC